MSVQGLVGCGATPDDEYAPTESWICSDGSVFQTSYDRDGDTMALSFGGETLILRHVRTASGAKYSNGRTAFWSKGEEALIERDGEIVHRECRPKA
jgi:membrane-bound inhibitor of C-type lysozyme